MKEILSTYPVAVWSLVSVLLAAIVIMTLWDQIKWWWMNAWYRFPLIGGTASLARDPGRPDENGWRKSELKLCRDYKRFLRVRDEHDFNEKISYLTKAGDLGRRPTPMLIWVLTIALVFVEAMGFSYVLAGYTVPGASEDVQQLGALGIAFLISVLLVAFTHYAGHELYVSGKIAHALRDFGRNSKDGEKFRTQEIALAMPQSLDDAKPMYTQLANRVGGDARYVISIGTAVFVLIVAIGATYVRGQVLEKSLHQHTVGLPSSGAGGKEMDMGALQLPTADAQSARDAETKAQDDENAIDSRGGWGTFIVLAFIFVFLQVLGVLFGFRWGFAGKESFQAYRAIGKGKYSSYSDVRAAAGEIMDRAQATLEGLQQQMMLRGGQKGDSRSDARNTFGDFIRMERESDFRDRESERDMAAREGRAQRAKTEAVEMDRPVPRASPSAMATHVPAVAPAIVEADPDAEIEALRQQLAAKQMQREQGRVEAERLAAEEAAQKKSAREAEKQRLRAQLASLDDEANP